VRLRGQRNDGGVGIGTERTVTEPKTSCVPIVFGTIRASLPWRHVFNLSVELVPVMACCGQPAGCGMIVAGGFCSVRLVDGSSIARESQNSPDSLWGRVLHLLPPTGSSAAVFPRDTPILPGIARSELARFSVAGFVPNIIGCVPFSTSGFINSRTS